MCVEMKTRSLSLYFDSADPPLCSKRTYLSIDGMELWSKKDVKVEEMSSTGVAFIERLSDKSKDITSPLSLFLLSPFFRRSLFPLSHSFSVRIF